jgi:hypothetical protein
MPSVRRRQGRPVRDGDSRGRRADVAVQVRQLFHGPDAGLLDVSELWRAAEVRVMPKILEMELTGDAHNSPIRNWDGTLKGFRQERPTTFTLMVRLDLTYAETRRIIERTQKGTKLYGDTGARLFAALYPKKRRRPKRRR